MLRFITDEDFDNDILRGVLLRLPALDIVRVQDVGLLRKNDPLVLEWTVRETRILLTHDVRTMTHHAYARLAEGLSMPGVFVVLQSLPNAQAIEAVLLLAECSVEGEWEGQVRFLPL